MTRTGQRALGSLFLLLALICAIPALAQITVSAPPPAEVTAPESTLPDAPSASVPPSPQVTQVAQHRPGVAQSWWLVAPSNAPFRPLKPREKFQSFVHHADSPYTFAGAAYGATWAQILGDPSEFGGGMQGWGKRMGAAVAGTETRSFFGTFLFPTLLRQDPRYFAMYDGPVVKRGLHALSRVVITRDDNGSNVFNSSGMLSIAFTESLSMAWTPEGRRSTSQTFTRMLGAMQGEATGYLLREFTPDILRIFKRHAPARLKRIEERLPPQVTGDTARLTVDPAK
jgi:hypothetical protein